MSIFVEEWGRGEGVGGEGGGREGALCFLQYWYDCGGRNDHCHWLRACEVCVCVLCVVCGVLCVCVCVCVCCVWCVCMCVCVCVCVVCVVCGV